MRISDWSSDVCSSDLTPYTRYFLARLLQFQFYKAACDQAGWKGPLHSCSFYGNEKVGQRLNAMLELGASKPWPDALEAFTGARVMVGTAMIAYFRPLIERKSTTLNASHQCASRIPLYDRKIKNKKYTQYN